MGKYDHLKRSEDRGTPEHIIHPHIYHSSPA